MRFSQLLKPEYILLELETTTNPELDYSLTKNVMQLKENVLTEMSFLFEKTGKVANRSKLLNDLCNREKKASTGIGFGFAVPHVRTIQVREITMVIARSTPGIPFLSIDNEDVHILIGLICPPYADQDYLKIFKRIAQMIEGSPLLEDLLECYTADEMVYTFLSAAE
jgi:mannitol/fructose-specific phosphotransferase system IIA component (Ntr-type)